MPPHPPAPRTGVAAQAIFGQLFARPARPSSDRAARSLVTPEPASGLAGAHSEAAMGRLLAALPLDWTAFHALPLGPSGLAIDHVIVGPGGIFTVARHGGRRLGRSVGWGARAAGRRETCAGRKNRRLPAVEHEAARVTGVLRERMPLLAPAQPVIALTDPGRSAVRGVSARVKVVDAHALRRWLLHLQPVLTDDEIAQAVVILDSPATWRLPEPHPTATERRGRPAGRSHPFARIRRLLSSRRP